MLPYQLIFPNTINVLTFAAMKGINAAATWADFGRLKTLMSAAIFSISLIASAANIKLYMLLNGWM